MARVFLSLGSNMGDRSANISQAVSLLSMTDRVKVVKTSSFYETEPWGNKKQEWFVNACLAIDTDYTAEELLKYCQNIELKMGRIRHENERWGQRTIDIDILMYDNQIISIGSMLNIPHPLMHLRAFVLVPMLEVKADLVHPVFNKTISELYDELDNPEDVFLYGTISPKGN
ncbi:MAG: 2-amino-4-hydroxy-6-hydroxymethyldihydropteridine diphosphokinase [Candidatus Gastranaerophilales bacterium]|nr:2-amino-4-hydroxy-6-hydroxymethyldihydropteridine diphosphokinase [Candidatus Gastranaerophilales bacterium]